MSNKVLLAIPTAPHLDYGEYECDWDKVHGRNQWDRDNRRWDRVYGRFNGPGTERQQAVRETWWKHQAPATCKFFMGETAVGQEWPDDVVVLPNIGDKYLYGLQEKIQAIAKWAIERDFDIMVKLDDDTFVFPDFVPFLLELTGVDYGGNPYSDIANSGGCGYILSRRAMECLVATPLDSFPDKRFWEDWWVGHAMSAAGIKPTRIHGMYDEPHITVPRKLTFHPMSPKGLRQAYSEFYGHISST